MINRLIQLLNPATNSYLQHRWYQKVYSRQCMQILVHSLVTSSIDFGNGLLSGLPQVLIARLQRVQSCAARLVTRTRHHEHIKPNPSIKSALATCTL